MEVEKLRNLYSNLSKDISFKEFNKILNEPNIFKILKISNYEIRHSNFLAWLLDPKESHGFEEEILKEFINQVLLMKNTSKREETVKKLNFHNVEIKREWKNIDLLVVFDKLVICIENKIFSGEHSNQLIRYKEIVEKDFKEKKKLFIFLTPDGRLSAEEDQVYIPISYQLVIDILENIDLKKRKNINTSVKKYIIDYINTLKRDVMGNDELAELSREIYIKHKELFDFIGEIGPQELSEVRLEVGSLLREVLESKGYILGSTSNTYIRFTTDKIEKLVYINKEKNEGGNWVNNESFLFEFQLELNKNLIRFRSVVSPCDPKYNRSRLNEIIEEIPGSGTSKGKIWSIHHGAPYEFNFESVNEKTKEQVIDELSSIIDSSEETIGLYEKHFTQNEKELLRMSSI